MVISSPETMRALQERDLANANGRVSRSKIAAALFPVIAEHEATAADVDKTEITLDELSEQLIGRNDPHMRKVIAQVTNPKSGGLLQKLFASDGGKVVCGRRAPKPVIRNGVHGSEVMATRFCTRDRELLGQHHVEPQERTVIRAVEEFRDRVDLDAHRIPELGEGWAEQRKQALVTKATQRLLGPRS